MPEMPETNLEYLYNHLPARMRRDDEGLFLKRFLSFFGAELDKFDQTYDALHERVNPDTATEEFINWWLWALFGWGWFPSWFTLARKRQLYRDIARHYARRGTARGIEEFLRAFGVRARVFARPQYWGEFVWGEDAWTMTGPLGLVVRIYPQQAALPADQTYWGEFVWGEGALATPSQLLTLERSDIERLLRFQQPLGQTIMIDEPTR